MKLSTHYYVLSLSENTNRLYEAFRNSLIDIQNTWFPLGSSMSPLKPALNDVQLRALLQSVDGHFTHYYDHQPLGLVLAGTAHHLTAFASLTAHQSVIIGNAEGDYSTTSASDLGGIVWPIVRRAMASAGQSATRELEAATRANNIAVGIDPVADAVDSGAAATLWVEDGYWVTPDGSSALGDDFDNVVDLMIEKVLALGGNVKLVDNGSLSEFQRIALVLRDETGAL